MDNDNDYNGIQIIEIFKKYQTKTLPNNGWLQYCFHCGRITSNIFKYRQIIKERDKIIINVFLCKNCENIFKNPNISSSNTNTYLQIIECLNEFLKQHDLYDDDNFI